MRASSQRASSFVAQAPAATPPNMGFLSIRMDDKVNLAILEYKSSEGEVIRQYPSESQIRAFQRSSELQQQRAEAAQQGVAATGEVAEVEVATVAATPTQAIESNADVGTAPAIASGSSQSVLV